MKHYMHSGCELADELVYGADETGVQTGIGVTERVIGQARAKMQYQQRSGNRENITVLPTICADGTSLPPTVIYKGEAFQMKWLQENPLPVDARYITLHSYMKRLTSDAILHEYQNGLSKERIHVRRDCHCMDRRLG